MSKIHLSFYGELVYFICLKNRGLNPESNVVSRDYVLSRRASIKDIVESLGVPHTEIGLLALEKKRIGFDYIPSGGEKISICPHPIPYSFDNYLFPVVPSEIRFVVDVNTGKLARFLRMLGFDCAYNWRWDDYKIAEMAKEERRIVLTRDIDLLKRKDIIWGRFIRSTHPKNQLLEVITFFGLKGPFDIFSRCLECNTLLVPVDKEKVLSRLEPKTKKYYHTFSLCPKCNKIYWRGSHFERMKELLHNIIKK